MYATTATHGTVLTYTTNTIHNTLVLQFVLLIWHS